MFCQGVGGALWKGGGGGERSRRMNMVQIMHTHECKCKNDTCWNCSRNQEGRWKRAVEGVNANMIYLIHGKNLCKCYNVPPPSTTVIKRKEHEIIGPSQKKWYILTHWVSENKTALENNLAWRSLKCSFIVTIWLSNSISTYIPRTNENIGPHKNPLMNCL
jgi:hypothetical protein